MFGCWTWLGSGPTHVHSYFNLHRPVRASSPSGQRRTFHSMPAGMGEHIAQQSTGRPAPGRDRPSTQSPDALGRRLLDILVYEKGCRTGGTVTLDDLTETEIGDWKMPQYRSACAYAAAQGWLVIQGDGLRLTTAGFAAA